MYKLQRFMFVPFNESGFFSITCFTLCYDCTPKTMKLAKFCQNVVCCLQPSFIKYLLHFVCLGNSVPWEKMYDQRDTVLQARDKYIERMSTDGLPKLYDYLIIPLKGFFVF